MRKKIYIFLLAVGMLTALASLDPFSRRVHAQNYWNRLDGSFAAQFTGTVFLQLPSQLGSPFVVPGCTTALCASPFDGPFYRNALVVFDRQGNFQVTSAVSNYNGFVGRETFSGTYVLNSDGTFSLTIPNLPVPFLPPGTANTFSFDGVLANNGQIAKLVLSGINVPAFGGAQVNIGSVISGELVRQ